MTVSSSCEIPATRSTLSRWLQAVKHKIVGAGQPRAQTKVRNRPGQEVVGLNARHATAEEPKLARARREIRTALNDAIAPLSQFAKAVAAKEAVDIHRVNSDVMAVFLPVTQRRHDLPDRLSTLCGASLLRLLPKWSTQDLQALNGGLIQLKSNQEKTGDFSKDVPVVHQLCVSVAAELLHRSLFGPQLPLSKLSEEELGTRCDLANQLIALASCDVPSNAEIPGTRYSLQQLEHLEARTSHTLKERAKERTHAALLVKSTQKDWEADANAIQQMSVHKLRRLHEALDLHVNLPSHRKNAELARLQTATLKQLEEAEKPIIEALQRELVAGPFSKRSDDELMDFKIRIDEIALPSALLKSAMASISTQIDLRKADAKKDFQEHGERQ